VTVTDSGNSNVLISQIAAAAPGLVERGQAFQSTLTPSPEATFSVIFSQWLQAV